MVPACSAAQEVPAVLVAQEVVAVVDLVDLVDLVDRDAVQVLVGLVVAGQVVLAAAVVSRSIRLWV